MAANTANLADPSSALDLNNIRANLQRMEDSIVFSLIERSQYKLNSEVYKPDCSQLGEFKLHQLKSAGSNGCLGDWFIYQTECLHSQVARYFHPTEYPFFGPLPEPNLVALSAKEPNQKKQKISDGNSTQPEKPTKPAGTWTVPNTILANVGKECLINQRLIEIFRTKMLTVICEDGDCGNHGSTAVQDVHCLQTMATRIYYGLFVAESKFQSETEQATALIKARDRDGLMAFITKPEVEAKNIKRVILKARTFSQDIMAGEMGQLAPITSVNTRYKLDPEFIGRVFEDYLMPLTKDVEVEYLLSRLE